MWTNDDFVFKERTKLELFTERLDKLELNLDIVAGPDFCLRVDSDKEGHVCHATEESWMAMQIVS